MALLFPPSHVLAWPACNRYKREMCITNFVDLSFHIFQGHPPIYRDFHTATGMNEVMYVWGGREVPSGLYDSPENENYGSDLYALDTVTNCWSIVPCSGRIPIGRRSHSACESFVVIVFRGFHCSLCSFKIYFRFMYELF